MNGVMWYYAGFECAKLPKSIARSPAVPLAKAKVSVVITVPTLNLRRAQPQPVRLRAECTQTSYRQKDGTTHTRKLERIRAERKGLKDALTYAGHRVQSKEYIPLFQEFQVEGADSA